MNNKKIPLSVPNLSIEILDNIRETIETGWVSTGGRFIQEFEEKVAKYVGVENAISCQSGTAGLHLALRVLGVEQDDEVIVPTLTFIAAVNPIRYMGAEPIFMDCDESLNMDMQKLENFLEKECWFENDKVINKITNRIIKAIIVVHVFGNPVNIDKLMDLKNKYKIAIIEDATEALGSYYLDGNYPNKHCGTIGDIGVYSFNANKIITTGGGGMVVSNDKKLLDKVAFLSMQAKTDPLYFIHEDVGYNYRMTNIQAAFGTDQIDRLEDFIKTKIKNFELYKTSLEKIDGITLLPFNENTRANKWFYSIVVDETKSGINRDDLLKVLNENNIQTRPLWGLIHKQKPYLKNQTYCIEQAYYYEQNLINIPCSSNLKSDDIDIVISEIKRVIELYSLKSL